MATPNALNLIKLTMLGGILAIALSMIAALQIWRKGGPGKTHIVSGTLLGFSLLSWPFLFVPQYLDLPKINDVTTDTKTPPQFVMIRQSRPKDANDLTYPGETFAALQKATYPDLAPLRVNRSNTEAFEIVKETLRRMNMTIINEARPGETASQPGVIEAVDRTLILGFYDDVAVRIKGNQRAARIDIRSASRYGQHDLGQNALRTRAMLKEIVIRLEATVPSSPSERRRPSKRQKQTRNSRR